MGLYPLPTDISQLVLDFAVTLRFSGGQELRVQTECAVRSPTGEVFTFDPANPDLGLDLRPVFLHRTVVSCAIDSSAGGINLIFRDGGSLHVPADSDYEAWTLTDSTRGTLVVANPGGGITEWDNLSPKG